MLSRSFDGNTMLKTQKLLKFLKTSLNFNSKKRARDLEKMYFLLLAGQMQIAF